jgi:glycosyltransferase involved in cell wall biosynthesis
MNNINGARDRQLVLHIVESYAGGVKVAIDDYVRNSPQMRHALLFAPRKDAPLLDAAFDTFEWVEQLPKSHLSRFRYIRKVVDEVTPDVVHAHSSYAGAYVRAALSKRKTRLVYTPHCYAFEREDLPAIARAAFRILEHVLLLNTSTVAACSYREADLSRNRWSTAEVVYVPNVVPNTPSGEPAADGLTLVGAGRASAQKDPAFFAHAVDALRRSGETFRAIWIGGDDSLRQTFAERDIEVTGWLPRDQAVQIMRSATAYLHSARWEGFPLAVLEAVALQTPLVARKISSFDGYELPLSIEYPSDIVDVWGHVTDPVLRSRVTDDLARIFSENVDDVQASALASVYAAPKVESLNW